MSVWSRSHNDLAKLARTLQNNNSLTKRRLSTSASRTRSMSPQAHLSKEGNLEQVHAPKPGSVQDVSLDHVSFQSDDSVVNRGSACLQTTPRVNVTSADGSESSYSDVFLQSSASDYSEVFHSVTATPDARSCQNRDVRRESKADVSPSVIPNEESESQGAVQKFTFNGSVDSASSETSPDAQPSDVLSSVDSGIEMCAPKESGETKPSLVPSDMTAGETTGSEGRLNSLMDQSAKQEKDHLCAVVVPSSPRLSLRSPDLLRKLREVTTSISANKAAQKMKSDGNGQVQRSVSRRRLKKLIARLRLADQSATPEVSGLSDFSRTVADLQHLCLFLSRNLELQTQQHLLDQQQQRLREHQQQVLREQTSQELHTPRGKDKRLQSEEKQEETQLQGESRPQNSDQNPQEQKGPEHKDEAHQTPVEGGDSDRQLVEGRESHRQLLKDPPHTRLFLKLRQLNHASQKAIHTRLSKTSSRAGLTSPKPEATTQQRTSRFQRLAADVNPEVLIQEACKNTELLERLGVDKDLLTTGKEEGSPGRPK
ncbi:hypothetical protein ACOMHN_037614 [Nucella lapillus]